jgi:hypothetical protein
MLPMFLMAIMKISPAQSLTNAAKTSFSAALLRINVLRAVTNLVKNSKFSSNFKTTAI